MELLRDGTQLENTGDAAGRGSGCPAPGPGRYGQDDAVGPTSKSQHQGDPEASLAYPCLPIPKPLGKGSRDGLVEGEVWKG